MIEIDKTKDVQEQLETEHIESSSDKYSCLRFYNEIAATVILTICAICVVVAIVIFAIGSKRAVVKHEFTYTIKVDSTGNVTSAAQIQVDSIISSIKQYEHLIQDRYDYVLEQRENSQDYLTIGGIFITVILSIFGFFGYKSFKSIEEEAKTQAKKVAEDNTEKIAEEKATSVANKLNKKLNNELKKEQKDTLHSLKKEDIPDMVTKAVEQKFGAVVGGKMSNVEDVLGRLSEIEKDITQLKKAKDEEALLKRPARKKKLSLADGPGIQPAEINGLDNSSDKETIKSEG